MARWNAHDTNESTGAYSRDCAPQLADEVLDQLLDMIERGKIEADGFRASERDLMRHFGVGRPAVREALQTLAGMGIIQIQHGERARVVPFDASTVLDRMDRSVRHLMQTSPSMRDHLRDARLMFETGMVRMAARLAKDADLVALRKAFEQQIKRRATRLGLSPRISNSTRRSPRISGNPIYAALSEATLAWCSRSSRACCECRRPNR